MEYRDISLEGRIDLHVHVGPDVRERKMNVWELIHAARKEGMKALVIKNHFFPTVVEAGMVNLKEKDITIYGGIALNYPLGGVNPSAVEKALQMGAKIIWMPTLDAEQERSFHGHPGTGISILDALGNVNEEVRQVLQQVAEVNCVLATGHLSYPEIIALLEACNEHKIERMLVNHPGIIFQRFSIDQQKKMVELGAYLEHSYCRPPHTLTADALVEVLKAIGTDNVVLATDLGQPQNNDPVNGMKELIALLRKRRIDQDQIDVMTIKNPAYLLGLRE